jgi:hypothetical protein
MSKDLTPESVTKAVTAKKFAWIDSMFKRHLPRQLYEQAHSGENRTAVLRIAELGYNVQFVDDVVIFRRGEMVLAKRQFVVDLRNASDLKRLSRACKIQAAK